MLAVAGIIALPWEKKPQPSHAGEILVPLSARTIPAYSKVVREDLLKDIKNVGWNGVWVAEKDLAPGTITDARKIIGRVLDHDKRPDYSFTEDDFLPLGTRPGLVAGIPPGKRSLTIEASRIPGLHGLRVGDHFDVLATLKVDKNHQSNGKGPPPSK
ncbi:MAG TPA: hypothetical protein VHY20_01600, partial [Pirellulales bacterium]|nr:hypothetical protein [Pirellulales bacterium]